MNDRIAKIHLFYCVTNLDPADLEKGYAQQNHGLKAIPLPCSGKVDILYLTKAFETGADGVAVLTCPQGECQYLEGNLRARKRVEAIDTLLEEIGLGRGRVAIIQMGDGGMEQVARQVADFRASIKPVPVKKSIEDESELDHE